MTSVELNAIPSDLIRMTINQLPAFGQVAISRVCKRFEDNAFKDTTILDVYDIPDEHRIDVANKMPMLTKIEAGKVKNFLYLYLSFNFWIWKVNYLYLTFLPFIHFSYQNKKSSI